MSRPSPSSRPGRRRAARGRARRGFSLIEILVVIGLIAFLTAAIVAVIPRVANAAKVAATRATIKKVDEMLNDRINGFRRWIQKQDQIAGNSTTNPPSYVSQLGITASCSGTTFRCSEGHRRSNTLFQQILSADVFRTAADNSKCQSTRRDSHVAVTDSCRDASTSFSTTGAALRYRTAQRQPTSKRSKRPTPTMTAFRKSSTRGAIRSASTAGRRWIQKQDLLAGPGNPPAYVSYSPYVAYWSQSNPSNQPLLKILATKWVFQASFPQAFTDMKSPFNALVNPPSTHQAVTESSECLYQFLTQGPLFDTEPPSAADLKAIETADTDGDGLPEIVDAWGNPLRFYRWPTRLVRPAAWSSSNSTSPPSLASPGPLDEIPQQPIPFPPPSVVVPPSPLSLAMIGAAPRPTLSVWSSGTPYSIGQQVVSGQNPGPVYSVVYQCVVGGTSGSGPFGTPVPAVGTIVTDNTVQWQVLLDPLSVDPDDPYGIAAAASAISESSAGTAPFFYPQTPNTWSVPLVVSCGTDGQLGLFEPYETGNFGNLAQPKLCPLNSSNQLTDPSGFNRDPMTDNITNHQQ